MFSFVFIVGTAVAVAMLPPNELMFDGSLEVVAASPAQMDVLHDGRTAAGHAGNASGCMARRGTLTTLNNTRYRYVVVNVASLPEPYPSHSLHRVPWRVRVVDAASGVVEILPDPFDCVADSLTPAVALYHCVVGSATVSFPSLSAVHAYVAARVVLGAGLAYQAAQQLPSRSLAESILSLSRNFEPPNFDSRRGG